MRRATACSHIILGLSPGISSKFSLDVCTAAKNRNKNTKTPYFVGSRLFKVIDVNKDKKLVTSTCAAYLCLSATVFTLDESMSIK